MKAAETYKLNMDSTIIQSNNKYAMIDSFMDGAQCNNIISYLKNNDITNLEFVIITHPHRDHCGCLEYIIEDEDIDIEKIYYKKFNVYTRDYESDYGRYNGVTLTNGTILDGIIPAAAAKNIEMIELSENVSLTLGKLSLRIYNAASRLTISNNPLQSPYDSTDTEKYMPIKNTEANDYGYQCNVTDTQNYECNTPLSNEESIVKYKYQVRESKNSEILVDTYLTLEQLHTYFLYDSNAESLAVLVKNNYHSALIAGDIEQIETTTNPYFKNLAESARNLVGKDETYDNVIDIYKASHHGIFSNNPKDVLDVIKPKYAIITNSQEEHHSVNITTLCMDYAYQTKSYWTYNGPIIFDITKSDMSFKVNNTSCNTNSTDTNCQAQKSIYYDELPDEASEEFTSHYNSAHQKCGSWKAD